MLDQITTLEDGDIALPTASLDLSTRMRDLRARQGLKQSEVARRMRLDPSIPSLWEQGKRLVPANRLRALAEALEVSIGELLDGVSAARPNNAAVKPVAEDANHAVMTDLIDERTVRPHPIDNTPLLRLLPPTAEEPLLAPSNGELVSDHWIVPERPPLEGWIPEGWNPADRVQDITPNLPDGYWLDPIKLEKSTARHLLKSRLCAADQVLVAEREVPGAALAERLYAHCSRSDGFFTTGRLPLAETIFRCVISADHGGLTDGALVEMLRDRSGAVPVSTTLLRRLRDSVRPYPIRRVDADLFGGRR